MIRYLIQRPIAVLLIFTALCAAGLAAIRKIPVSLLPDADVPEIVIRVNRPNAPARVIEESILRTLRENLGNLDNLANMESTAADHYGIIHLSFEHGTRMDLTYITVNEKLDRLTNMLPPDMLRPQVVRINTSDIPVIRIQVIPKDSAYYLDISALAENVLKRRLEQLKGVSLVDINGKRHGTITVEPDHAKLSVLGLNEHTISRAITEASQELETLNIKDGQYRYFIKFRNALEDGMSIGKIPIRLENGTVIPLERVARVQLETGEETGYHLYNGKEALVITVQKQASGRMNELIREVRKAVASFRQEYPQAEFRLTQDQTYLLDAGIGNLRQDLLYGGALTILLLFAFLGNWASPFLMGISIPLSLIITFLLFYLLGISFNIISLSGLALGIGMLIDNSIVVLDSITRKRKSGMHMQDSCIAGTNDVVAPVISQVLTTVAVYAPLMLLGGMAGTLISDQAIGLTASLGTSLLVAFILTPLLYKLLHKKAPATLKEDTVLYKWISKGYHRMIDHILQHRRPYFAVTLLLMPIGCWIGFNIPATPLPDIEKRESLIFIDWNSPVDITENLRRSIALQKAIAPRCIETEAEVGVKEFLLQQDAGTIQQTEVYFSCKNESGKLETDQQIRQWLAERYPKAAVRITDAPNAFTQLFSTSAPYMEARFRPSKGPNPPGTKPMAEVLNTFRHIDHSPGDGLLSESNITVSLDYLKMAIYGVQKSAIEDELHQLFGARPIASVRQAQSTQMVLLGTGLHTLEEKLTRSVPGADGNRYPLKSFITLNSGSQPKFITADKGGAYQSLLFGEKTKDLPALQQQLDELAAANRLSVDYHGQYFENGRRLRQLWIVFLLVLLLLYCILALQYESTVQPIVVMATIPLGITGGMLLLWLTSGTINTMSAIGFIVVLGLIVDDPILKVEVLNRLEKKYLAQGLKPDEELLKKMIHEAGDLCLKPLLMVSLTTSIALVPVLLTGGIGNDLQKPLAMVIIGGLTIGTFFTTWFTPLAYYYLAKWRIQKKANRTNERS